MRARFGSLPSSWNRSTRDMLGHPFDLYADIKGNRSESIVATGNALQSSGNREQSLGLDGIGHRRGRLFNGGFHNPLLAEFVDAIAVEFIRVLNATSRHLSKLRRFRDQLLSGHLVGRNDARLTI